MPKTKVLIVEDNKSIRNMLELFLFSCDFIVVTAENGVQGLKLCLAHHPDLVITDNTMPLMTGLELITAIRTNETVSHAKIIMVSGDVGQTKTEALAAGANAFMAKPYDLGELLHLITKELA